MNESSIGTWLSRLKSGDDEAARQLFARCYPRLVGYARRVVEDLHVPRRARDEEDFALSALDSFLRRAADNRFEKLNDEDDLWKLLFDITLCKALEERRRELTGKRGGGKIRGESVFQSPGDSDSAADIDVMIDSWPTPADQVQLKDTLQTLLDLLDDDIARQVATKRLEGYSVNEIAEQLKTPLRTVQRKLERIRSKWSKAMADLPSDVC
jgi:RNA polymerase sigma factor (sigma-70 family)